MTDDEKAAVARGRCPKCAGVLYDIGTALYCPSEHCAPGGLVIHETVSVGPAKAVSAAAKARGRKGDL